jgi:hypothetical protein
LNSLVNQHNNKNVTLSIMKCWVSFILNKTYVDAEYCHLAYHAVLLC